MCIYTYRGLQCRITSIPRIKIIYLRHRPAKISPESSLSEIFLYVYIPSALHIQGSLILGFHQPQIKNTREKKFHYCWRVLCSYAYHGCICTKHVQMFFLSFFAKQHFMTTIHTTTVYEVWWVILRWFEVYGMMCVGYTQILCSLPQELEHPQILVTAGVLGQIPCRYRGTTVFIFHLL